MDSGCRSDQSISSSVYQFISLSVYQFVSLSPDSYRDYQSFVPGFTGGGGAFFGSTGIPLLTSLRYW